MLRKRAPESWQWIKDHLDNNLPLIACFEYWNLANQSDMAPSFMGGNPGGTGEEIHDLHYRALAGNSGGAIQMGEEYNQNYELGTMKLKTVKL